MRAAFCGRFSRLLHCLAQFVDQHILIVVGRGLDVGMAEEALRQLEVAIGA